MKRFVLSVSAFALLTAITTAAQDAPKKSLNEPPKRGIHWAKGHKPSRSGNPLMIWHNGAIMTSAASAAIFWGPSWVTNPGDKISGMDTWYSGFGNSNYAATSNEYTGTDGQVTSSVPYGGHFVDSSTASGGSKTSVILAEVCRRLPQLRLLRINSGSIRLLLENGWRRRLRSAIYRLR